MAPLVVRDHVILGVGGDLDNIGAFMRSIDPETGKTQWQWNTTPPDGTPNATTGGTIWLTGTYDPDLNLLYTGTGNPTPVLNGKTRPGTTSIHAPSRPSTRIPESLPGPSSLLRMTPTTGMPSNSGDGRRRLSRRAA